MALKPRVRHENNGRCIKCMEIFDRYPGFYEPLRAWFEAFQMSHPEAHISCAGRGYEEQEALFQRRASRAHYGQSAHNYGAAIDVWENTGNASDIYEKTWFREVLKPRLTDWLNWYGEPGSSFYELPHIEVRNWKAMAKRKTLKLVEPDPEDEP